MHFTMFECTETSYMHLSQITLDEVKGGPPEDAQWNFKEVKF